MRKITKLKLAHVEQEAKTVAKSLIGGETLALIGPLGAGKTTFVKALGQALKIKSKITSPTFALMHAFPVKLKARHVTLYHLDLYRLNSFKEAKALGLAEFWGQPESITIIEWANKIKKHLPKKTHFIYFKP